MARLGAWAALALGTSYLVFIGGGWQGIYTSALRSISTVIVAIAVSVWFAVAWRRPAWRPKSIFLPAIAACLVSVAVTTARSRHPRLGIEYVADAVVLAALYLLLVRILAQPWFRARMATLATALGFVIGALYVALTVGHWLTWWGFVGRITVPPLRPNFESLTFGNPAAVMTMSVLLASVAVASIGVASRGRAAASLILVLLAGLVTFLSGSRAGWLAVAAAVVVTAIAWLVSSTGRAQARAFARTMVATPAGRIATALAVFVAAAGTVVLGPAILLRTGAGGEDLRVGYLTAAVEMFKESPFVGTGPGTWVAQRVVYTVPPTTDYYIPHAHNVYLQTLAEQGLLGGLVGAILIVSILTLIWRASRERSQWAWVLAAVFSTAYFAAHQLFDFYMNFPSVMFAAALPI
ncbi:MAG: O-antigen ligase family protein, partial [Chloroflexi bacterium]|nr:O-antigen ligase family protein [Chloroflexota bacterium]